LIRGSLGGVWMSYCGEDNNDLVQPFVFLADIVLLG